MGSRGVQRENPSLCRESNGGSVTSPTERYYEVRKNDKVPVILHGNEILLFSFCGNGASSVGGQVKSDRSCCQGNSKQVGLLQRV
jgi:hypothetical protein